MRVVKICSRQVALAAGVALAIGVAAGGCNSLSGIDDFAVESEAGGTSFSEGGDGAYPGDEAGGSTDGTSEAARDGAGGGDEDATVDAPTESDDRTDRGDRAADGSVTCGTRSCATPFCCDGGCASAHSNGLGQFFYDCSPLGTFNLTQAFAACVAFTGKMSLCANDPINCGGGDQVCSSGASMCACWRYNGNNAGHVESGATCNCLGQTSPTWN
jgi:hypothetical protein